MSAARSQRPLVILIAVAVVSLLLSLYTVLGGHVAQSSSSQADGYSRSALGHRGLVNLLRDLGVTVTYARIAPRATLPQGMIAVLAEPRLEEGEPVDAAANEIWAAYVRNAQELLIVLPKWDGIESPLRPGRVYGRRPVDPQLLARLREISGVPVHVVPADSSATASWHVPADLPQPVLDHPQLIEADSLTTGIEPLWWCDQGVLLARWRRADGKDIRILSDPDLLNNEGLGRGENALLVLSLLADMGVPAGGIMLDETLHGHGVSSSAEGALLRPPLVWLTLHLALLLLVVLWLANERFGAPRHLVRARRDGKAFIVANTASLLLVGRHETHLVKRYWLQTLRVVARARHLDPSGGESPLTRRLDRLPGAAAGRSRTLAARVAAATRDVLPTEAALTLAQDIHLWKQEMLDGTQRVARDRGPAA